MKINNQLSHLNQYFKKHSVKTICVLALALLPSIGSAMQETDPANCLVVHQTATGANAEFSMWTTCEKNVQVTVDYDDREGNHHEEQTTFKLGEVLGIAGKFNKWIDPHYAPEN